MRISLFYRRFVLIIIQLHIFDDMKKGINIMNIKHLLLLAVVSLTSTLSFASSYGVIDYAKVIENSSYLKQQNESLNQSIKPTVTKLEQLSKELNALQEKANLESTKLKENELKRLEQEFQTKLADFNKTQQELQVRMQQSVRQMNSTIESRIVQIADQLRTENKLDIILERGAVLSYDKKFDLTDRVIQRVNAIK